MHQGDYSPEEVAQRGDAIYERSIRDQVEPEHDGEVVAIDIVTGVYAIGHDALTAARRLRAQEPNAVVWFVRVGSRSLYRMGIHAGLGRQ